MLEKKNQIELKKTVTIEGINSRLDDTEEQINELEGRIVEIIDAESKKEKNEDSLRDL